MFEITNLRDGAVLDHTFGIETIDGLEIVINGIAPAQANVTVNGIPAIRHDRNFTSRVKLTGKINQITAEADDFYGKRTITLTVVWDKGSFKRYNFFFDDCIFFLRWIALNRPQSVFEEMFLKRLKDIHEKYNSKFMLNLFYHDDHHDFALSGVPDCYKAEFQANSDWLKFSFHAYSEFPDRPYQHADAQKLASDFDLVRSEVCRFAGEKCFIAPMVIHWAMTNPDNFAVLQERGTKCLAGGFLGSVAYIGEKHTTRVTDIGYHYEQDTAHYLKDRHIFYDRFHDILLLDNLLCCNLNDMTCIENSFAALQTAPRDTLSLMSHEQYCYSDYFNYIPDHLDRVERSCQLATEAGYKPVWFPEGILGNTAWGK